MKTMQSLLALSLTISHKVDEVEFGRPSNGVSSIDGEKNHSRVCAHFQRDESGADVETWEWLDTDFHQTLGPPLCTWEFDEQRYQETPILDLT